MQIDNCQIFDKNPMMANLKKEHRDGVIKFGNKIREILYKPNQNTIHNRRSISIKMDSQEDTIIFDLSLDTTLDQSCLSESKIQSMSHDQLKKWAKYQIETHAEYANMKKKYQSQIMRLMRKIYKYQTLIKAVENSIQEYTRKIGILKVQLKEEQGYSKLLQGKIKIMIEKDQNLIENSCELQKIKTKEQEREEKMKQIQKQYLPKMCELYKNMCEKDEDKEKILSYVINKFRSQQDIFRKIQSKYQQYKRKKTQQNKETVM